MKRTKFNKKRGRDWPIKTFVHTLKECEQVSRKTSTFVRYLRGKNGIPFLLILPFFFLFSFKLSWSPKTFEMYFTLFYAKELQHFYYFFRLFLRFFLSLFVLFTLLYYLFLVLCLFSWMLSKSIYDYLLLSLCVVSTALTFCLLHDQWPIL